MKTYIAYLINNVQRQPPSILILFALGIAAFGRNVKENALNIFLFVSIPYLLHSSLIFYALFN